MTQRESSLGVTWQNVQYFDSWGLICELRFRICICCLSRREQKVEANHYSQHIRMIPLHHFYMGLKKAMSILSISNLAVRLHNETRWLLTVWWICYMQRCIFPLFNDLATFLSAAFSKSPLPVGWILSLAEQTSFSPKVSVCFMNSYILLRLSSIKIFISVLCSLHFQTLSTKN